MEKLVVGTYNLSAAAVKHRPEKLMDDLRELMSRCHVLLLQEAGEAGNLLRRAEDKLDVKVFFGYGGTGQAATPIMYRRSLKIKKRRATHLTRATYVGSAGAGPNTLKQKWLLSIMFKFAGRRVNVGGLHTSPSIYIEKREQLAREQLNDSARESKTWKGLKFIGGDLNSLPQDNIRNGLELAGMRSTQIALGKVDTMGKRNIDDVYYFVNRDRVRPVKNYQYRGASDHDAYIAVFEVNPTRLWRLRHRKRKNG
jgi:hypothetical protein